MSKQIENIDDLLETLEKLRQLMNNSLLEAYIEMKKTSEKGKDCRYVLTAASKLIQSGKLEEMINQCEEVAAAKDFFEFMKEDFLNGK